MKKTLLLFVLLIMSHHSFKAMADSKQYNEKTTINHQQQLRFSLEQSMPFIDTDFKKPWNSVWFLALFDMGIEIVRHREEPGVPHKCLGHALFKFPISRLILQLGEKSSGKKILDIECPPQISKKACLAAKIITKAALSYAISSFVVTPVLDHTFGRQEHK